MGVNKMNLGQASLTTPAALAENARLDDNVDLPRAYKSMWANSSGTAKFWPVENDDPITLTVVAGTPIPFSARRVSPDSSAQLVGIMA